MFVLILVLFVVLAVALLHGHVESYRSGPSHCMGCGKCDHNGGVCVLTGRPLTEVRAGKTSVRLSNILDRELKRR